MAGKKMFILEVQQAQMQRLRSDPPSIEIVAAGVVNTSGWSEIELVVRGFEADGMLDVDFVGIPPKGIVLPVITPVQARVVYEKDVEKVHGAIVEARSNKVVAMLPPIQPADIAATTEVAGEESQPGLNAAGQPTTLVPGAEGPVGGAPDLTTLAVGEEGGPIPTTLLGGEEGGPTTLRLGEEGPTTIPFGEEDPTTLRLGEEGGPTTFFVGEEGGPVPTTRAVGEEDPTTAFAGEEGGPTTFRLGEEGDPSTRALGEEGPTTFSFGEENLPSTLALGEEGGPTTFAVGEEGNPTGFLGEDDPNKPFFGETDLRVDDPAGPIGVPGGVPPVGPFGRR